MKKAPLDMSQIIWGTGRMEGVGHTKQYLGLEIPEGIVEGSEVIKSSATPIMVHHIVGGKHYLQTDPWTGEWKTTGE
jgi:hypothetical protein